MTVPQAEIDTFHLRTNFRRNTGPIRQILVPIGIDGSHVANTGPFVKYRSCSANTGPIWQILVPFGINGSHLANTGTFVKYWSLSANPAPILQIPVPFGRYWSHLAKMGPIWQIQDPLSSKGPFCQILVPFGKYRSHSANCFFTRTPAALDFPMFLQLIGNCFRRILPLGRRRCLWTLHMVCESVK